MKMKFSGKKFSIIGVIVLVVLILIYFFRYQYLPGNRGEIVPDIDSSLIKKEVLKLYDIPVDSFSIVTDVVKRNEMLLTILLNYNLPEGSLANLLITPPKEFDLRKIKAGNRYTVFMQKDSFSSLRYFVYEITPVDFVKISFDDSVKVEIGHKQVVKKRKFASGIISTSLWNSMKEKGYSPELILQLSEIYAWSVDFFGLQPADSFSVVYEENYIDSIPVGIGRIHGAYFKSNGIGIYAIPFTQDSVESYYDSVGNSLRKAFLKAPLRFSRISSRYSNSRLHPILKIRRPHHGVDYKAPSGTPVYAIGDGTIIMAGWSGSGGGNAVKIRHNSVYTTSYMHLSGFGAGIRNGKYVKQGDVIGYVGSTGLSTGAHLDFRFYKNGSPVNPLAVEAPPVEPVKEINLHAFDSARTVTLKMLNLQKELPIIQIPSNSISQ
jgi:murein DD-endopeptidase MepM/ murein hydrolase activator NlpD